MKKNERKIKKGVWEVFFLFYFIIFTNEIIIVYV